MKASSLSELVVIKRDSTVLKCRGTLDSFLTKGLHTAATPMLRARARNLALQGKVVGLCGVQVRLLLAREL